MNHTHITQTPRARVQFTLGEAELLLKCSKHHYDGVCKMASSNWKLRSCSHSSPTFLMALTIPCTSPGLPLRPGSEHDLDTMAKILEVGNYVLKDAAPKALALRYSISNVIASLNKHYIEPVPVVPESLSSSVINGVVHDWSWEERETDVVFRIGDTVVGQLFNSNGERKWSAVWRFPSDGGPVHGFHSRHAASEYLHQLERNSHSGLYGDTHPPKSEA